jgi:hypothetical protein
MNREALGCGAEAVSEGCLAQQCHKLVEDRDIRKVDLTVAGEAATCIAMFQQMDRKPANVTPRTVANNDSPSRNCWHLAGAFCAAKSKRAPAKVYSDSAGEFQPKRKSTVNCQTEVLARDRTVLRILPAIPS